MRTFFFVFFLLSVVLPTQALAQSFAVVAEIQATNAKGNWKKVSSSAEALLVLDDGTEVPLEKGMGLDENALVRTAMARVVIQVGKNEIHLRESAEARVQQQGVLQTLGSIYYSVRGAFTVRYGTVEAVVEGTQFEVHGPDPIWVGVMKGKVRVRTPDGEVLLKKDQKVEVNDAGSLGAVQDWSVCLDCGERHGPM